MNPTVAAPVRTLVRLARLLERAGSDLGLAQYRVLAMVAGGDQRATRLAECLAVAKPTVTAAVDALVERGFVERTVVPTDRRAAAITATPAGMAALAEADLVMAARLEPLLARVDDRPAVLAALAALGSALDELMAEHLSEPVSR
ncbi:MAG: MarR family transcriptional regulator [Acidimicrobiales bacterium]